MPTVHTPYYDGDFTVATQVGPVITGVDPVTFARFWTYKYVQRASYFQKATKKNFMAGGVVLGQKDRATGGFLVETPDPRYIDGDILEFERTFSEVPLNRIEYEQFNYTYQWVADNQLIEAPKSVLSKLTYTYVLAVDPSRVIKCAPAPHFFTIGSSVAYIGASNRSDNLSYVSNTPDILAEDETFKRWKGIIWEKKSRTVPRVFKQSL